MIYVLIGDVYDCLVFFSDIVLESDTSDLSDESVVFPVLNGNIKTFLQLVYI